jgi:hypothetical protein
LAERKRTIGERYDREALVDASSHADRLNEQTLAHAIEWLKELGVALLEGERRELTLLDDGRALLTLRYRLGPLLTTVVGLDALRAMVLEDRAARAQDAGDGPQGL